MRIRCVIGVLNVSGKPLLERRARAAVRHVNVLRDGFAENRFNFAFRLIGGFLRAFDGNRRGDDRLACRRFYAARLDDWLNRCGQGLLSRRFAGGCFHDRLDRRGDVCSPAAASTLPGSTTGSTFAEMRYCSAFSPLPSTHAAERCNPAPPSICPIASRS